MLELNPMEIIRLKEASESALKDINALLTELRGLPTEQAGLPTEQAGDASKNRGTLPELREVISNKNTVTIAAKDGGRIIGMGLLYSIIHVGRRSGHIEDVVVDSAYRGRGLGEKIMQELISAARKNGLKTIYLTSKPERKAANHLYQKLGFVRKETNVYKLPL